ncbi:uncharacterized protein PHALS_14965 [Plasmopara halstedii]|uniref:Uncharacterized protein n=1 Tax=Plasmopara halstedii TaxID=4781 RepID=A0A0P1AXU3_PLAHL|nr:uncharacterized protein PHALS_14965 [Plasmopara halstedii]CEG47108.1 hypothetical protein PHALS_14965 [Plasmopara halstedii]|eukprot:XP_024583477.1 hypothetical protein PHALS_14965 [Plasmopara halstedii]
MCSRLKPLAPLHTISCFRQSRESPEIFEYEPTGARRVFPRCMPDDPGWEPDRRGCSFCKSTKLLVSMAETYHFWCAP